jgi:uncharacterized protein YndB with AHSA1/START domain
VDDDLVAGGRVARLVTTGRTSGQPRTVAVGFLEEPDGSVLVAARSEHAGWARNHHAEPPGEVFAQLTDLDRWPEWLIASGIVGVRRADATDVSPLGEGTALRIDQRVAGRATVLDARVTAFDAPRRFALEGRDADGVTVAIEATLTDRAPGTHLRWGVRLRLPFRLRVFESMVRPQADRAARLDLEAFRRRLDTVAG